MTAAPRMVQSSALETEVLRDPAALLRLRGEWSALCEMAEAGCLFLTPEWLIPWFEHFGAGRELCCIAVREEESLLGFLPLFTEVTRIAGVRVRRVAFLGDGATGCDYLDMLVAPGRESEVRTALLEALGELSWDVCDLDGLWRESATAHFLAQRFPTRRGVSSAMAGLGGPSAQVLRDARLRFVCPHIPLTGTYEDFLLGLGRRENLRRREKWLHRQPGVSIELARTPEESRLAVERFLDLHRARWSVEGGSDGLSDDRHEAFHRVAVQTLAERGWLRLYTLFAARRAVASVYGVVHKQRFLYYQSGYDPAWRSKSVGLVLLARTVQDAYGEGLAEFDFLRGDEGYKAEWARAERWTIQMRLWRGTVGKAARTAHNAAVFARESIKAAIPAEALEAARRARRLARAQRPRGIGAVLAALRSMFDGTA
ncbi:MAG TPA: GNAT family N-acetyltransferase [Myxococcales bacterium]|nr:GNAT family N-acetyltransferase [Myxococcales bacterium]